MSFDVLAMLSLGRVNSFAIAPNTSWIAVAVARNDTDRAIFVSSLWRVSLDGKPAEALTRGVHSDRTPAFGDDGTLFFLSDRKRTPKEEDPKTQVWALLPNGGEPMPITDEPLGVSSFRVGGDRLVAIADVLPGVDHAAQRARAKELADQGPSALHYKSTAVRHWDHWIGLAAPHVIVYDTRGGGRRDLTPKADVEHRGDLEWDLSADGTTIAVVERRPGTDRCADSAVRVIDTKTASSKLLGAVANTMLDHVRISPSGRSIACVHQTRSREAHGKSALVVIDSATGSARTMLASWDRWPMPQAFADENTLLVTAEEEGTTQVHSVDLEADRHTRLTTGGTYVSVACRKDLILGIRNDVLTPPEVCRIPTKPGASVELLTQLAGFSKEFSEWATVSQMRVTSKDGTSVHSYVVAPKGVKRPPVLIWIHGGPVGAFGDLWHWRWNPLVMVACGYAIVLPNPRGSTGYGQAHVEGIWRNKWGAGCYEDIMAVADALEKRDDLDGTRMVAMGGSFGGYMTNWIGGQTTRFSALVTHASIFHMEVFAGSTDYPGWFQLENDASPRTNVEALNRYSPHRFVTNWRTPTLIIHGEKDYRVPIGEALVLYDALCEQNVNAELLVFPDENHWIQKPRNIQRWYEAIGEFLDRHVLVHARA